MKDRAYAAAASQLWKMSKTDWHANISYILTEPVCAIVSVRSDDPTLPELREFLGTGDVNESIKLACEYLIRNLEEFYKEHPERKPE